MSPHKFFRNPELEKTLVWEGWSWPGSRGLHAKGLLLAARPELSVVLTSGAAWRGSGVGLSAGRADLCSAQPQSVAQEGPTPQLGWFEPLLELCLKRAFYYEKIQTYLEKALHHHPLYPSPSGRAVGCPHFRAPLVGTSGKQQISAFHAWGIPVCVSERQKLLFKSNCSIPPTSKIAHNFFLPTNIWSVSTFPQASPILCAGLFGRGPSLASGCLGRRVLGVSQSSAEMALFLPFSLEHVEESASLGLLISLH